MRVLLVKTSSLGDIVHTLPALTDAQGAIRGLRCDWLAEEPYAEIPAWHPAVDRAITCDLRGWRRAPLRAVTGGDWSRFRGELRASDYDQVIDVQGLVKSAWLARSAKGPHAGPDWRSAREPLAAFLYNQRYPVPRHDAAHAVDRARILVAQALSYTLPAPDSEPDAGIRRGRFADPSPEVPYAVLLHGTTWPTKRWPRARWCAIGASLRRRHLKVVLPWGSASEKAEAVIIANASSGQVLPASTLTELAGWLAHARVCVGVDTGLAHLAAALGTPQVTLYGPTQPELTGAVGRNQVWLRSSTAAGIHRDRPNDVAVEQVEEVLDRILGSGGG